jgi:hypothetical protein
VNALINILSHIPSVLHIAEGVIGNAEHQPDQLPIGLDLSAQQQFSKLLVAQKRHLSDSSFFMSGDRFGSAKVPTIFERLTICPSLGSTDDQAERAIEIRLGAKMSVLLVPGTWRKIVAEQLGKPLLNAVFHKAPSRLGTPNGWL